MLAKIVTLGTIYHIRVKPVFKNIKMYTAVIAVRSQRS